MRLNIILVRYLFIFLLFAVLLLFLFLPVYNYITDFFLKNELTGISNRMEQGILTLNSLLTALEQNILTTRNDSRFSIFMSWIYDPPGGSQLHNTNPNILHELRTSFNSTLLPYSLPADAGLIFPDGTAVTRHSVSYYPSLIPFYGFYLRCGDLTLEEWRKLLAGGRTFIPPMTYTSLHYATYEAVTYAAHWAYIGYPEKAMFFATLPVHGIVALLTDTDVAEAAYIRMYDANGGILFSWGGEINKSFHTVSGHSSMHSLRYEINIPDSFIAGKLQTVRNQIFLFACITAVFVIILSFFFAWRSSLPESNFLDIVRPGRIAQTRLNVFSGFRRLFQDLADSISTRESELEISLRTMEAQAVLIRTQTIDRIRKALLSGDDAMAHIILRECVITLSSHEDSLITGLFVRMLSTMIKDLNEELSGIVSLEKVPEYIPGTQMKIFEQY